MTVSERDSSRPTPRALEGIVFFGTPEFAVPTLSALIAGSWPVRLVVSQPARRAGRGGALREPPVAVRARELGLEVVQPGRVREPEFLELLAALEPTLAVVAAFGQIFTRTLLRLPALGCVNLHASLLPRWRGAAPVAAAIAAGDETTGVTTMQMARRLDSGPILLQRELAIGPRETAAELEPRLAALGAELMLETVAGLAAGTLEPRAQEAELATFAPILERADGRVDWQLDATSLFNRLRGFTPWPGLHAELGGRPVKLVWAEPLPPGLEPAAPGRIAAVGPDHLAVGCGGGTLLGVERLQRPGGKVLAARDFVNGERLRVGDAFD